MQAVQLRLDESLKNGVATKDRYGPLPLPLVVAVQVVDEFRIAKIDVMDGLFGPEAVAIDAQGSPRAARVPDGAWITANGPIHRTISAVMAWSTLEPWNFTAVEPIVVHDPYASMPLANDVLPLAQYVVDHQKGVLVEQAGQSIEDLLGLAKEWVRDA